MGYTELQVTTNFSFLLGGSHPEEIVDQAAALGYKEIAITDRNTLAGIVRAHVAAKKKGMRIIPACRLDLLDGPSLLAYPISKAGYANLSGLLTTGNLRTEKGQCHLKKADVFQYAQELKFIVVPPASLNASFELDAAFIEEVIGYKKALGDALYLGAVRSYQPDDGKKIFRLNQLAQKLHIPMIALNDIHYHHPVRRELQDVLTCIREKCTIYDAGFRLCQNAERFLKPANEMERLFMQYPDAIRTTKEISDACQFTLDSLEYVYPEELAEEGVTPQEKLVQLTWEGAHKRFGTFIPEKHFNTISMELEFIGRKNYASYFLTVYDFVAFAKRSKILCQGRGSAANSVVCYCLEITSVHPEKANLLFARFMSDARDEPPDIDVDFEHERREEVMQYIYGKYSRERAGIVATVTQVHYKGAIRDVGKVMGISADAINRLSGSGWEFTDEWLDGKNVTREGFDAKDPHLMKVMELTRQYIGFPRQLGQHTGGFVITQDRLSDLCPIINARMEKRTCIEWNKDDIEALGFLKVDVLALGMLTCLRKGFDLLKKHYDVDYDLASIPEDDPKVYDMICEADTIGVFQIESRAQMSMLPRLKPRDFYDLVIEVAIVRPGPIQGNMVHPYLKNRQLKEQGIKVKYPKPELEEVLEKTLGVPLFQEQAMRIAIVAGGFTPAEADELRRSMATFKAKGQVSQYKKKLIEGMIANGYEQEYAERIFKQLEGFGAYGFPESHAASFALLVYVSSYIKCYYPDVFAVSLLNSLPMGFYQPAQIVIDAQKHGVTVLPVDINYSNWNNTLEKNSHESKYYGIRLGFRQVKGLKEEDVELLTAERMHHFKTISFLADSGMSLLSLEHLADADAFRSIGLDRRQALWEVTALKDVATGIYHGQSPEKIKEESIQLPLMQPIEHVLQDYQTTALSLKAHPVSFMRRKMELLNISATNQLDQYENGASVKVGGLILVRQRPGTATGICFITIEDETGIANLVVFRKRFDFYRKEILDSKFLMVEGQVQIEGKVIHIVVKRCVNLSELLSKMNKNENKHRSNDTDQTNVFPNGRNFR